MKLVKNKSKEKYGSISQKKKKTVSDINSHISLNTYYLQPKEVSHVMKLNFFITLSNWIK